MGHVCFLAEKTGGRVNGRPAITMDVDYLELLGNLELLDWLCL